VVLYYDKLMKLRGFCSISFWLFFSLDISFDKNSIHIYLFIRVIYTFIILYLLHISHSSFHTAEKCICLLYYYRVLVQCTYFVFMVFFFCSFFVYEEQSCYSIVVIILFIAITFSFLPIHSSSYLFYCEKKDIKHTVHDIRYSNKI
jgi:hypothetical protein